MNQRSDNERFAKVVEVLRPWLPEVVVAGGWAHRLHRLHALAETPGYLPLATRDVDVAVASAATFAESNVRERLQAAGFKEEVSGEHRPPITYYQVGTASEPFYVEFLTPLVGSENRRDGTPDVTIRIGGISAQKLRHLDVLLLGPWSVTVGAANGFPLEQVATVRVPNPATYVAQKLLILKRRKRGDQERDILYVHDTLRTFGGHLPEVREAWLSDVVPHLHARQVRQVNASMRELFSHVSDLIRGAAHIAASVQRSISPQSLLDACQLGLARILQ